MVILSEFRRTAFLFLLEDAVEIAEVVEPAMEANFRDAHRRVDQHSRRRSKSHVDNVVGEVSPRVQFEKPAEGAWTHPRNVGQLRQPYFVHVVFADEVFHLQYPPTIVLNGDFSKA